MKAELAPSERALWGVWGSMLAPSPVWRLWDMRKQAAYVPGSEKVIPSGKSKGSLGKEVERTFLTYLWQMTLSQPVMK